MPREEVVVTTRDGQCPAVVVTPEGQGPWPAVIVFMDAGGLRPSIVAIAERIAAMGYVAFAPEMYYRSLPYEPFDMASAFGDDGERARLMGMITALTKAAATSDSEAFLDYLADRPDVAGTRVGTTGYCMGGGISLTVGARFPDRVAAVAGFHAGNVGSDAPDSPHLIAGDIAGKVYLAAASDDRTFPPEQEERLVTALTGGGVDFTLETYPALHGFAVGDSPSYDAAAAERHYRALESLYGSTLGRLAP